MAEDLSGSNIKGLGLSQNVLTVQTPDASLSGTEAGLASALGSATSGAGSAILFSAPGGVLALGANDSLEIAATGAGFDVDAGLSLGEGLFKLTAAGVVNQTAGSIVAGALQGSSVGGAVLTEGGNKIAKLSGWSDASGAFALTDAEALAVTGAVAAGDGINLTTTTGGLSLSRALSTTSGGVTLDAAGTVVESAALGTITAKAGELAVTSVGGVKLQAANQVKSLSIANTGAGTVSYTETGALTVTSASNGAGGTLTLADTTGEMNIAGAVTGGKVTLTSAGGLEETASGAITATTLVGSAAGTVNLSGANQIATLGNFTDTAGAFALTNGEALKQSGTLNAGSQTVSLTATAGNIAVDGTIEAGTLTLDSKAGALTESGAIGAIKVGTLNATAATGITLTGTHNDITTIGINSPGSGPDKITQ